jgi:hypothetical protein
MLVVLGCSTLLVCFRLLVIFRFTVGNPVANRQL